jgi:hypothetical protein
MKSLIAAFLFVFAFMTAVAQETDENTFIINQYFQNNQNNYSLMNRPAVSNNAETYVNLIQTGYNNNIRLNSLNEDTQTVHQVGNKNDYENFVYFNKEKTNKTINQEGNMNSLLIFGENSMMKNLIINQKADFQSIVIKNFTN